MESRIVSFYDVMVYTRKLWSLPRKQRLDYLKLVEQKIEVRPFIYFCGIMRLYKAAAETGDFKTLNELIKLLDAPEPVFKVNAKDPFKVMSVIEYIMSFLTTRQTIAMGNISWSFLKASYSSVAHYSVLVDETLVTNLHDLKRFISAKNVTFKCFKYGMDRTAKLKQLTRMQQIQKINFEVLGVVNPNVWTYSHVLLLCDLLRANAPNIKSLQIGNDVMYHAVIKSIHSLEFAKLVSMQFEDAVPDTLATDNDSRVLVLKQHKTDVEIFSKHCPLLEHIKFGNLLQLFGNNKANIIQMLLRTGRLKTAHFSIIGDEFAKLNLGHETVAPEIMQKLSIEIGTNATSESLLNAAGITLTAQTKPNRVCAKNIKIDGADITRVIVFLQCYEKNLVENDELFEDLVQLSVTAKHQTNYTPIKVVRLIAIICKFFNAQPKLHVVLSCDMVTAVRPAITTAKLIENAGRMGVIMHHQLGGVKSSFKIEIEYHVRHWKRKTAWNWRVCKYLHENGWKHCYEDMFANSGETMTFKDAVAVRFDDRYKQIKISYPATL